MKRLSAVLAVIYLLAFSLPACGPEPQPSTELKQGTQADVDAIHQLYKRFDDAVTSGECEALLPLLTDDVFYMVPNQPALIGHDAVRMRLLDLCAQLDMEHITTVQEVQVADTWSFARGKVTFRVTPKTGGETIEDIAKLISIQRRHDDDSWKISHIIWNSDKPLSE